MAKSRRESLRSTLAGGHDFMFEYCCDLCEEGGNVKEAVGYCSDCKTYLCVECFTTHLRPKPLRHHKLLDQHQMPKDQSQTRDTGRPCSTLKDGSDYLYEDCCDLCEGEGKKTEAVGYCSDCHEYLCTDCFRHHTRPKPSRHHVLLDQHHMPKYERKTAKRVMLIGLQKRRSGSWSITGCVVLPGDKLVLMDTSDSNVLLVNLTRGDVVSQLELPGNIWSITKVSSTQVAVTNWSEQTIYFVNVGDTLKLDYKVKVKGQCYGVACINDNIVVSYDEPAKVEIISKKGKVRKTVVTESKGRELFTSPWFIAVSKDEQIIYISDVTRSTVTSVDLTGRVQATYKNKKLLGPFGLTVDTTGTVHVCDEVNLTVHQLAADLTLLPLRLQLFTHCQLIGPCTSVCYCEATNRLCFGISSYDYVEVYKVE